IGCLAVSGDYTQAAGHTQLVRVVEGVMLTVGGNLNLQDGSLFLSASPSGASLSVGASLVQSGGLLWMSTGNLDVDQTMELSGGTFELLDGTVSALDGLFIQAGGRLTSYAYDSVINGDVSNAGILDLLGDSNQYRGQLRINGNYSQSGALNLWLN